MLEEILDPRNQISHFKNNISLFSSIILIVILLSIMSYAYGVQTHSTYSYKTEINKNLLITLIQNEVDPLLFEKYFSLHARGESIKINLDQNLQYAIVSDSVFKDHEALITQLNKITVYRHPCSLISGKMLPL